MVAVRCKKKFIVFIPTINLRNKNTNYIVPYRPYHLNVLYNTCLESSAEPLLVLCHTFGLQDYYNSR